MDLPADVLCLICSSLVSGEPIKTLPLVSKKLLEFTQTDTRLWKVVKCCLGSPRSTSWDRIRPKLQAFVCWLYRRAAGVQRLILQLDLPDAAVPGEAWWLVGQALASVALNLEELELKLPAHIEVGSWLASMRRLTRAALHARQLQLTPGAACCRSLRHLSLSLPAQDYSSRLFAPELSFQVPQACLPPGLESLHLHGVGLDSLPKEQRAQLWGLLSLKLSYNRNPPRDAYKGLSSLTTLRELSIVGNALPDVPHQISLLAELRVLCIHPADTYWGENWSDSDSEEENGPEVAAAQFEEVLGPLRHLAVLSLYGCGLEEIPPAVADLTSLRVLHIHENHNSLQLCPGPYLAGLRELFIDWTMLYTSHTVLGGHMVPHLSKLLLNGSQHSYELYWDPGPPAAVAASLASCPSLVHLVDVLPEGSGGELDIQVAELMYLLPCACPHLNVAATDDANVGYSLDTLPPEWGLGWGGDAGAEPALGGRLIVDDSSSESEE